VTTILKIQSPRFGACVRIRHTNKEGVFKGMADRKHGHVQVGTGLRTYPVSDIIEIQAPAGGER
jgi:hypothetical protein